MNSVSPGQLWSVMDVGRPRYTLRVTRVVGARVHGTLASGKETSVALAVLAHGQRGARLVEHADGRSAALPKYDAGAPVQTCEDTKTASDYVKTFKPKGVARAGDKEREALRLREEEKVPFADLAKRYGVTRGTMSAWLSRARAAREEERNQVLGRTG
jgi:hypothetical protein